MVSEPVRNCPKPKWPKTRHFGQDRTEKRPLSELKTSETRVNAHLSDCPNLSDTFWWVPAAGRKIFHLSITT